MDTRSTAYKRKFTRSGMETEYTKEARDKNEISRMDIPYGLLSSTLVTLNRLIYYVA